MPSDRVQRQVDSLLDEAEAGIRTNDWATVRERAHQALTLDLDNPDALALLDAAERGIGSSAPSTPTPSPQSTMPAATQPTAFANGRYTVTRFLGEGGKKKVYLAGDSLLDRDVALALIKTEGLDEAARQRVSREAQAMGRLGAHPNVVTVFDIGEENAQPFLILPVMNGGDVEGLIDEAPDHRLSIERGLRIVNADRTGARSAEVAVCLWTGGTVLLEHGERAAAETAWQDLAELADQTRDVSHTIQAQPDLLCLLLSVAALKKHSG